MSVSQDLFIGLPLWAVTSWRAGSTGLVDKLGLLGLSELQVTRLCDPEAICTMPP